MKNIPISSTPAYKAEKSAKWRYLHKRRKGLTEDEWIAGLKDAVNRAHQPIGESNEIPQLQSGNHRNPKSTH